MTYEQYIKRLQDKRKKEPTFIPTSEAKELIADAPVITHALRPSQIKKPFAKMRKEKQAQSALVLSDVNEVAGSFVVPQGEILVLPPRGIPQETLERATILMPLPESEEERRSIEAVISHRRISPDRKRLKSNQLSHSVLP